MACHPALLLLLLLALPSTRAAESYDGCTGTISSLPTSISTPGTWCLKSNLSTDLGVGAAITINSNNVTLDCNGFRIGGLAAGNQTFAVGVLAVDRFNVVVRRCVIRGFSHGIDLFGAPSGGYVVEDNRLDQMTTRGILVDGSGCLVQRNQVTDIGGRPDSSVSTGLSVTCSGARILDNQINGVTVTGQNGEGTVLGIVLGNHTVAIGNLVTDLVPAGSGEAFGISSLTDQHCAIRDNHVFNDTVDGVGIQANLNCFCSGNRISGYPIGINPCFDAGDNFNN